MHRVVLTWVGALAVTVGLVAAASRPELRHGASPHQSSVAWELAADSVAVPITLVDGHVRVMVMLNGKGPFPFLFDTGAQGSVMDLTFAGEQGFEFGEEVMVGSPGGAGRPGRRVTIGSIELEGLTIKGLTSIAFDGLPFPRTADSPRGVLGPYSLAGLLITLDYPRETLTFTRGVLPEPDGQEIFGWEGRQRLPEIPIVVGGESVTVHLDTGSSGGVSVPTALAPRLSLEGPLTDAGYAQTVDQVRGVRAGRLRGEVRLGRFTVENPMLTFVDMGAGVGNVGVGILGTLAITVDPAHRRLRLTGPADGRLTQRNTIKPHYGMQLTDLGGDPPEVLVVDAGSPAARGGVNLGDRLVAMNGRPVAEMSLRDRVVAIKASPLQLTVERGGAHLELKLSF